MNRKTSIITIAVLAVGAGLVGCGSSEPAPTVTVTVTAEAVTEQIPDVVEGEPADDGEGESSSHTVGFGETVDLGEEGAIAISAPAAFTPSETAAVSKEWPEYVAMEVTETNTSDEPVMAGWSIQATTGSREAEAVFDSAQDISSPTVDIMPGKSITYKVAFGRNSGEDFVVSASPLAGFNTAYFQ